MKIYTKNGDSGKTSLLNERVSKTNLRIEINGQIDELLVLLGFLIEELKDEKYQNINYDIKRIYKNLFMISSIIADVKEQFNYKIDYNEVSYLEQRIDVMAKDLPKLKNFIYYTGKYESILSHEIRAKVRSVERRVVELYELEKIEKIILIYLNRLSDYFYILARYINYLNNVKEEVL